LLRSNIFTAVVSIAITATLTGLVTADAAGSKIYGCVSSSGALSKVGIKAPKCPKGTTQLSWGTSGSPGAQGLSGLQGFEGKQGLQGLPGLQGEAGEQGLQGLQGLQGSEGKQGIQGEAGSDGGGVTVYSGNNNRNTFFQVRSGFALHELASTGPIPKGKYLLSVNAQFQNIRIDDWNLGYVNHCRIVLQPVNVSFYQTNISGHYAQSQEQDFSVTTPIDIPWDGQSITLACGGHYFDATVNPIVALKIVNQIDF
jgi:hypothetical protein